MRTDMRELKMTKMFKTGMWMKKYKSATWKRTWLWSTSPSIGFLDKGRLLPHEKVCDVTTATRSKDSKGKSRYSGTSHLKGTQYHGPFMYWLLVFGVSTVSRP